MSSSIIIPEKPQTLYAIETAVVDVHYEGGDEDLKKEYFSRLPELLAQVNPKADPMKEAPRPGDMRMVVRRDFDKTLGAFADDKGIQGNPSEIIFGTPTMHAGGSLANTFDSMVKSRIDGKAIYDGVFATCCGTDKEGAQFEKSFENYSSMAFIGGTKTMTSHIVPIDGDRIMITTPNGEKDASNSICAHSVNTDHVQAAGKIMIGGYLNFRHTADAHSIYDKVFGAAHLSRKNPKFVLTAAAQPIAEMPHVREQFDFISSEFDTTIHANTGEFRRLLDADTDWRKHTSHEFKHLDGDALEVAKKEHDNYNEMKGFANQLALQAGVHKCDVVYRETGKNLEFVVTNGSRESYFVDRHGFQTFKTPKVDGSKIVSTVGAGDAHMAGYQVAEGLGLSVKERFEYANKFAAAIIQSPLARLDENASCNLNYMTARQANYYDIKGPLAHALKR